MTVGGTGRTEPPLIVGAGPTGLAAALFLAERGVRARVIDRAPAPATTSRAQVVNPRSLDLLASTGVSAAIVAEGRPIRGVRFYEDWRPLARLNLAGLPSRFSMTVLPQARTEALLAEALAARGVEVRRGVAFDGLEAREEGVEVTLKDGTREETVLAPVLLGADGSRSHVRDACGIAFDGHRFPEDWPLHDLELDDPLDLDHAHVSFTDGGLVFLLAIRPGLWRVFGNQPDLLSRLPPGARAGASEWDSTFHVADRLATRLVAGRVALAGDAAHIHSPMGARGMNLGIEDAFVFAACAADLLTGRHGRLEDYARLRHPVHERVVARMDRLTRLARGRPGWVGMARRVLIPGLAGLGPIARPMGRFMAGLDRAVELA